MTLTGAESCCLKLLRLCATPARTLNAWPLKVEIDGSGNHYHSILVSLHEKGFIFYKDPYWRIDIL